MKTLAGHNPRDFRECDSVPYAFNISRVLTKKMLHGVALRAIWLLVTPFFSLPPFF